MTPEKISLYRQLCESLLKKAIRVSPNENTADYQMIVEKRDSGSMQKIYSSCGDLAHWMYEQIGIRSNFVNRASLKQYKQGWNVAKLSGLPFRSKITGDMKFNCGDVIIVWDHPTTKDAHVICVVSQIGNKLHTAEFGQPAGKRKTYDLKVQSGKIKLDGRTVQVVIPLSAALNYAESNNQLTNIKLDFIEQEFTGEMLDFFEQQLNS